MLASLFFTLLLTAGIGQALVLTRQVSFGARGPEVSTLQSMLGVRQTGYYGLATLKAVRELQRQYGLAQTGNVGPATLAKINESPAPPSTAPPVANIQTTSAPTTAAVIAKPAKLSIPAIGVNAGVSSVGLTASGNMDMISSITNVAWYSLGAKPGETGTAVMGGHYAESPKYVFHNLENLKVGDSVYVTDASGNQQQFIVRQKKIYGKDEIVPEVFTTGDDKAHLNLIACNGTFIPALGTYDKRLVVFTDLVYN